MKPTTIYSKMKNYGLVLFLSIGQSFIFAQTCDLTVTSPSPSIVCPGTPVTLSATASMTASNQAFNFNIGSLPTGWSVAGGATFSAPCGAGPDGAYFWASTAGSGVPFIQTANFNVCSGGSIVFDMRYAVQAGSTPCEGPDEPDEGVSIQYSINNGATWVEFVYYHPNGSILAANPGGNTPTISGATPFTTWGTYSIAIPPAAVTTNTIFRWIQTNSSGTCCDNWGIDNIFINAGPCLNANIDWSTGDQNTNNIAPIITQDTCITADVYDDLGNYLCTSDPFCFTVFDPTINGGPDQTLVCQGGNTTLTASGGTGFTWDNSVVDGVPFTSPLGTTTYTVTGTDPNGCLATDQVNISVIVGTPPPLNAGIDQTICLGSNVTLTASGATNYVWANGGVNGQTVSPTTTTTYIVTGGDGTCVINDAVTITVVDPMTPTFTAISDVCIGAPAPTLPTTSTNGIAGTWSGAVSTATAGTFNFTFTPTAPTCNPTAQISVTIAPMTVVNAGIDQTVCEGTPVTLTATGAANFLWNNTITNGVPFTPPVGGPYDFIVTSSGGSGCSNADTVEVTVVAVPVVDAGLDQTICLGQSVNLTATGATTYVWDNAGTNGQSVSPLVTTTYNVVGSTSGCQDNADVTITVNPLTVPTFNPTANLCQGTVAPAPPSSSLNDVPGTWSPATINTSTAGTTNYTFTPNNVLCNTVVQVAVTIDPLPVVNAGTYAPACMDAASIPLVGSPAGGVFSGTGVTGNNFSPAQGTQTVTYTYTDANSCSNSANSIITVNPLPIVDAGNNQSVCQSLGTVTLTGTPLGGTFSGTGVTGNVFSTLAGTQIIQYVYTDGNGCTNTDNLTITVEATPTVDAGNYSAVCENSSIINLVGSPAGGTYSGTGVTGNTFNPASGTQTITYNYSSPGNCSNSDVATITVNSLPIVDAGTYTAVCIDAASIPLVGSPTGGVFSGTGVTGNNFSPAQGTQTVIYTYTDGNGCTNTDNQLINIFNLPAINAGSDITICEGQSVTLSGTGGTTYSWTNGVINNQSFTPSAVGQGTYTVTGTDANGCVNTDIITVTVVDMPQADAIEDVNSGLPGLVVNFMNNSSITPNYLWNFGDGSTGVTTNVGTTPTNTYDEPGTYYMVLTVSNGICTDYDTVKIIVIEYPEPIIEVPNVFTPNGDGSNEFFFIDTEFTKSIQYIIVNRWGNLVFEDEGVNPLWNGNTTNGTPVEEGVYFLKYVVIGLNGETYDGHGSVTLIRD